MQKRNYLILVSLLTTSMLLASCGKKGSEPEQTATKTIAPTKTSTITPSPSITCTPKPTLTDTPTPTETVQWDDQGLSLTPIPSSNEAITAENASRVKALAVWGDGKANTITLSPDGSILGVGTTIGAYFYDSYNFSLINTIPTPYPVDSIAFSADHQLTALGQSQGRIDVYNQQNFTFITRLTVNDLSFTSPHRASVFFSRDSNYLTYVLETDEQIYSNLWQVFSWQSVGAMSIDRRLMSYQNPATSLTGLVDGYQLTLQSLTNREEVNNILVPENLPYEFWRDISKSGGQLIPFLDGSAILINTGNTVLFWDLSINNIRYVLDQYPDQMPDPCLTAATSCRNTRGGFSWVCSVDVTPRTSLGLIAVAPDSSLFLVSRNDDRTELHSSSNGVQIWEIDTSYTEITFFTRDEVFYGLKKDGTIEQRSLVNGDLINLLNQHPSQLTSLQFSPDSTILAAAYSDGLIRVYSSYNGELLGVLPGSATALRFSPGGSLLAAGLQDGIVRVFELNNGRYSDLPIGHLDKITGLAFSNDGDKLFAGSLDCTISLWSVEGRHRHWSLTTNRADPFQVSGIVQSPIDDSKYLFADQYGLFQVNYPDIFSLITPSNLQFSDLAISSDGNFLAATHSITWLIPLPNTDPIKYSKQLQPATPDEGLVLTFSADSSLLIVSSSFGLEFWSIPGAISLGELSFQQSGKNNKPVDIEASPDGYLIALGKSDGLVYIFGVNQTND